MKVLKTKFGKADISKINSQELATEICIAVAHNDQQKIKLYVEAKIDLSIADYDGRTPLHIASNNGYTKIAQMLIDGGADTQKRDNFDGLPLMEKKLDIEESAKMIQEEQEKDENQGRLNETRTSLSDIHVDYSHQTKRMLISVLLCNLVDDGNLPKIRDILLSVDDLTQIHDYDFRTPLHIAAVKDRAEIAQFLINRGAKINSLDRWRRSPLYEAVTNKSKKVAKILAQHQGSFGISGMELAVFLNKIIMSGDLYMLQLALLTGVSVSCSDYDNRTPLHVAGDLGLQGIYEFLLAKGADQSKKDRWGKVPSLKKPNQQVLRQV